MRSDLDVDIHPAYPLSWQARAVNGVLRGTVKPLGTVFLRGQGSMRALCALVDATGSLPGRLPRHVTVRPEDFGDFDGEWVRWGGGVDEGKVLLYFHGGGYFVCSPATHRPITWRLSRAARRPVLAIAYRQGPVHRLSVSLEDALTAYGVLLERGYAPEDVLFAGDSAGGHLTLASMLALRDRGLPLPRAAICLSPWADLTASGDYRRRRNRWADPMLPAGRINWVAGHWTRGLESRDPLVSPVFGDYTGLPPLMIVVGSTEILRDEGRLVAERARVAGVPVTYEEWHRMPHVFPIMADVLPEARLAFRHVSRFLAAVHAQTGRPEPVERAA
ncbi:alpha/beta hydrolase [Bailinhaonella thermotolerans]|uniref:Alpha/beta hydrolase n=1 Tax=Bailinhaonella thermotolerans TaxID=1070861 RepID=A0A3A4AW97_9ACTN|nr:alpha/beta hydrolase [Bailinhaonella thermotolerans]RJL31604.1 alpha/beta hydrolase [Bailinhaonella thermotolerans]